MPFCVSLPHHAANTLAFFQTEVPHASAFAMIKMEVYGIRIIEIDGDSDLAHNGNRFSGE